MRSSDAVRQKRKKLVKWCFAILAAWVVLGTILGCIGMPPGPRFVTKSPDGKKEFYLYRPLYRRIIRGMMYPIEWPLKVASFALVKSAFGDLYCAEYSLYVRDTGAGRTDSYSARWVGVWSPDSRWIACAGPKKHEQVPLMLIDAVQKRQLVIPNPDAPRNWWVQNCVWSQDSRVVFFRQEYTVYAFDLVSRRLIPIAHDFRGSEVDVLEVGMKWKEKAEQATPTGDGEHGR